MLILKVNWQRFVGLQQQITICGQNVKAFAAET